MAAVVLVSAVSCRLAGREFEQTQPLCITNLVLELPGTIADFDTDNFVAGYTDKFYEHL